MFFIIIPTQEDNQEFTDFHGFSRISRILVFSRPHFPSSSSICIFCPSCFILPPSFFLFHLLPFLFHLLPFLFHLPSSSALLVSFRRLHLPSSSALPGFLPISCFILPPSFSVVFIYLHLLPFTFLHLTLPSLALGHSCRPFTTFFLPLSSLLHRPLDAPLHPITPSHFPFSAPIVLIRSGSFGGTAPPPDRREEL